MVLTFFAFSVVEDNLEEITHAESLLIDLSVLRAATANFSEENKLGAGGFGAVYKVSLSSLMLKSYPFFPV